MRATAASWIIIGVAIKNGNLVGAYSAGNGTADPGRSKIQSLQFRPVGILLRNRSGKVFVKSNVHPIEIRGMTKLCW